MPMVRLKLSVRCGPVFAGRVIAVAPRVRTRLMVMKYSRAILLGICVVIATTGWAQEGTQATDASGATVVKKSGLPVDVAGYVSFRRLNDVVLSTYAFNREYAGSLFVSKTVGSWRFHSEINATSEPEYDAEGIRLFPRRPSLSIKLDSALVNYNARDWFQIEAGFLFVPTYWRTHRYQSTTMTVDEPLMDQHVFPTAFKGAEVHGDKYFESGGLSYQIYMGQSQEKHFSNDAVDHSRAFGAKLVLHVPSRHFLNAFDIGYHRLHELYPRLRRDQGNAVELYLEKGPVTLLAEFAHSSIRPVDGSVGHFREGYYLQPWYRITPKLFAVGRYEYLDRHNRLADRNALGRQSAGLTYRPVPDLSLKVSAERYEPERGSLPAYYGAAMGIVYFFHLQ